MKCDQLEDLILFHAGGAAEAAESRAVLEHLSSGCPRCAGRLAEAEAALASLPLAIEPVAPSPDVKRRGGEDRGEPARRRARSRAARRAPPEDARGAGPSPGERRRLPVRGPAPGAAMVPIAITAGIAADRGAIGASPSTVDAGEGSRCAPAGPAARLIRRSTSRSSARARPCASCAIRDPGRLARHRAEKSRRTHLLGPQNASGPLRPQREAAPRRPTSSGSSPDQKKIRAGIFDIDASGEAL
jgi:hypothetical protein